MLLGNTEKGVLFIEALDRNKADISEVPFEKVKYRIAIKPAKPSQNPKEFWKLYHGSGYEALVEKYTDTSLLGGGALWIKKTVRKVIWVAERNRKDREDRKGRKHE